ncbi:zinc metalloproteinase nas-4-like [Rhizophagus irregularis DAOM 181602=DAOM 197198]|nr:zinc metalloproteinase nas-4-like [Rhizophagus irregularis DAOM 181602=DAOM 197198]
MNSILRNDKYCTILEEEEDMFSDVCTNDGKKLWEYGIVPYVFNDNVSDELKKLVMEAMKRITRVSVIKFVKRMNQRDYIKISDKGKFSSYVGRIGGKQNLHVTKDEIRWPNTVGSVMHELMHALGFYHEHCRPDRNEYVHVGRTSRNYERFKESDVLCYGPYDFESIMHYSEKQGVMLIPGVNARIGQRERLSDGDINALNNIYPAKYYCYINTSGYPNSYMLNYVGRLRKRRSIQRLIRRSQTQNLYYRLKLPRQETNPLFLSQLFNGCSFP